MRLDSRADAATIISAGVTKAGAATAVYGGLTSTDIAAFGGLIIAMIGLAYNIWHGQRRLKLLKTRLETDDD